MQQVMEQKVTQEFALGEISKISKSVSLTRILVTTDYSPESDRAGLRFGASAAV
jgi:hypothetical protein